jgi:hypothetical protein
MHVDFPNQLIFAGQVFNFTGRGPSPGSQLYFCPTTGATLNVFGAQVVSTGNLFSLIRVGNNGDAFPSVHVSHALVNGWGPIRLGWIILVAIDFDGTGPRAKAAWPAKRTLPKSAGFSQPATVEKLGTVSSVKPNGFGFIRAGDLSGQIWFHFSEARGFMPGQGMMVRYFVGRRPDGRPCAVNVRLT